MSWHDLTPSPDGTHHLRASRPAYAARFDAVMKFHTPGLAPVQRGDAAWHIDPTGSPAYTRRFRKTFGYYEGLAAVASPEGWHHITPDGHDVYPARYAWCGNFQEGRCAVRDHDGRYHHLDATGAVQSLQPWSYAGDFRDGIAVVQSADGRSTHVRLDGTPLHRRWFDDLDVFHKGLARARDARGWTHVGPDGEAAYARRFAMVEPFYNGQARVERFDGALEVIDAQGQVLHTLRPARRSEFAALSSDLVGYWRTQTIAAAVALGVFEAVPATLDDLAQRCTLAPAEMLRLLRALDELHLVAPTSEGWELTARGRYLRADHPLTLADASLEYAGRLGDVWSALGESLRAGDAWTAPAIFDSVAREGTEGHHRMLRSYARHDYATVPAALGLRGDERVIDAGGGLGVLSEGIARHHPAAQVVLLERPEVVAQVAVPTDLRERWTARAADLFAPWPTRADAVVLARVLHDWNDRDAARILRHARAALPSGGKLCVVEMVLGHNDPGGGLCDLHLRVATGGRERTEADFARLLADTGFTLRDHVRLHALPSVLRAEAV